MNVPNPDTYSDWKGFARALVQWLGEKADSGAIQLHVYTVGTLPSPRGSHGLIIYVSDEAGGAVPAFSENDEWLRVTDRTVVS